MQKKIVITAALGLMAVGTLHAQTEENLRLVDWQPKSQMIVKETYVVKPKFPAIDIHVHMGDMSTTREYVEAMDEAGVWMCVSLERFTASDNEYLTALENVNAVAPDRFKIFISPDFARIDEPNFGRDEAARIEVAVRNGIRGVQIFNRLGMSHRDKSGNLIAIDDPRLQPIWAKCGELGIPVQIQSGDPLAFHNQPVDRYNERYDEMIGNPSYSYYGKEGAFSKEELLRQRNNIIASNPNTIFIGAHACDLAEDLGRVSMWLDQYPNYYFDISARISELGRQPYTARDFIIRHQDRVLYGTDTRPKPEAYQITYRFLETNDEYFDPTPVHKLQGRWMIYGLNLPDDVLEKVYNKNALDIFGAYKGE
jgi:predicted TIM-barrel fold metal-dependent hydrolase